MNFVFHQVKVQWMIFQRYNNCHTAACRVLYDYKQKVVSEVSFFLGNQLCVSSTPCCKLLFFIYHLFFSDRSYNIIKQLKNIIFNTDKHRVENNYS